MAKSVHDILQEGIHGMKEIKPEERNKYLGTLRERIIAVLSKAQVKETGTNQQIEELLKKHPTIKMLLNGEMDYAYLSAYIKLANNHKIPFTITSNQEHSTNIGLVLAYDYAVNQKDISIN